MSKINKFMMAFAVLGTSVIALTGCDSYFSKFNSNPDLQGGLGEQGGEIIEISEVSQFALIREGGNFILKNDIDFQNKKMHTFSCKKNFSLDGNGFKLKNLNVYNQSGQATASLFGDLNSLNVTLKNLETENINVIHTNDYNHNAYCKSALLFGDMNNSEVTLKNCKFRGKVVNDGSQSDVAIAAGLIPKMLNTTIEDVYCDIDVHCVPGKTHSYMAGMTQNSNDSENSFKNTIIRSSLTYDSPNGETSSVGAWIYGGFTGFAEGMITENVIISNRSMSVSPANSTLSSDIIATGVGLNSFKKTYYNGFQPKDGASVDASEYCDLSKLGAKISTFGRALPYKNSEIFTKEFLTNEHSDVTDPLTGDKYPVYLNFDLTNWQLNGLDEENHFIEPELKTFVKEAK